MYFDGRKDPTRVLLEREDGNFHQDTDNEDPVNEYIGHLTPSSGKANDITRKLGDLCRERNSDLKAVGTDGAELTLESIMDVLYSLNYNSQTTPLVYLSITR